jgi:DNA polymerase I
VVTVTAARTRFYGRHTEADPTRRSYVVGEDAAREVARVAGESGRVSVDIETAGLNDDAFKVKVAIVATDTQSFVLDATNPRHCAAVTDALDNADELDFHKSAFDVPPLVTAGLMRIDHIDKVFDTLVCARMALTAQMDSFGFVKHGLESLEKRYLSGRMSAASKDRFADWAKANGWSKATAFKKAGYDHPVYQMYAGWDGIITHLVRPYVYTAALEQLTNHPFERYGADLETAIYLIEREQRVNRVMLRRSARGLELDGSRLSQQQEGLRQRMNELADDLAEFQIKDPSNRNQLAAALEEAEAFPDDYPMTKTGKRSTAKGILDEVDHPAVRAFREFDQKRRLFTYMEHARKVAEYTDGRVHPETNVMLARTGRMSYGNPELHQFTGAARTVIVGDRLVSIDWASIEPVIVANLAGDVGPIEQFETSGAKFYQIVEAATGVPYKIAKVVLLAALYGQQLKSLSTALRTDREGAKELQNKIFSALPMTRKFCGWSAAWSEEVGKTWTISGRIVDVPRESGYKGTNYSVQGSAYDVLAETIVACDEAGVADAIHLAIHDELVVDEDAAHDIRRIMETTPARLCELAGRNVKLRTDAAFLGRHWDDADKHPSWPLEVAA